MEQVSTIGIGRRGRATDDDTRDRAGHRDGVAAWLGLVPRQHTTGGKPRLGKTSKMGQRDLRRLLITGAMTVVRWAARRGVTTDPWHARMLARKPRMLVAVALANRIARIVWALMTNKDIYRVPRPNSWTRCPNRPGSKGRSWPRYSTNSVWSSSVTSTDVRWEPSRFPAC